MSVQAQIIWNSILCINERSITMGKKKKQHYVPQCYLENWSIPKTHQLYVYDKIQQKIRKSNITDCASENYFYDFKFDKDLSMDIMKMIGCSVKSAPESFDDRQYIENYFSDQIEGKYKKYLEEIIKKVRSWSLWQLKNCYFISEEEKRIFSFFMAIQYIRVKSVREMLFDATNCLEQVLTEMDAPPEVIKKYCVDKLKLSNIHKEMILNQNEIKHLSGIFSNYVWILRINRTNNVFFTSDNPIGVIPHKHHPYISTAGLQSEGVEICFPISPKIMLSMFEKKYHCVLAKYDRRISDMENDEDVEYYNKICAQQSTRCIFSCEDEFSAIERVLKKNPNALNRPQTIIEWAGKTFTPNKL